MEAEKKKNSQEEKRSEENNVKTNIDNCSQDEIDGLMYEPVETGDDKALATTDNQDYLLPKKEHRVHVGTLQGNTKHNNKGPAEEYLDMNSGSKKTERNTNSVKSIYQELRIYNKDDEDESEGASYFPLLNKKAGLDDDPIYDEVETVIPMQGAKIIPIEQPPSAYDEIIVNGGRYVIPSTTWDSDVEAFESDFDDDDDEIPTYFGNHLDKLYQNVEERKIASPRPRTLSFQDELEPNDQSKPGLQQAFRSCLPFSSSPQNEKQQLDGEDVPLYVDANSLGKDKPVMPPLLLTLSLDEKARYNIVNKILQTEAIYIDQLNKILEICNDVRDRCLLETDKLDVIFCSINDVHQCHEMFNSSLAERMDQWTVTDSKLGDIICASFSKATTLMAYTEFVTNFSCAIDTYRTACKSHNVFAQFVHAKENHFKPKITFHELMLKPFERFPEFIVLLQDLLEVTPIEHPDRVPLQLALTHLECLGETINIRRKETEMKHQVKYLDSQISQLNQPLSCSGRLFIRQDDMTHCLIDGVSVIGTKKLRLVLLSDMLLCLSPISKKKNLVSGLLNIPKYKYKLKWNVPLLDVQLIEYGTGVSVAAGKYGTVTKYSDEGKYRQATSDIQKHIEDLQHDMAVIGQIAGLASSLRGKHELIDQQKVEKWYKTVENTINEELKAVNMFWLEISLPTRSGQQSYVFNLSSPTIKQEWEVATRTAKLALETRNNPGWYLPDDDDMSGGLSILRRNMPLLDEFFDIFVFNSKSRVEQTLTYPVHIATNPTAMSAQGLGHYVWLSARGELQGNVTVLRIEHNSSVPRCVESFTVCPGTVYCMARIPAMNTRSDQTADKYKTKYGFPFPTIWLGSHSSRIYVFNAESKERNQPLMEIKLRDAPLDMKFTKKKIYVGLANGTLAIFRANSSEHWDLTQPAILPLGRYPVAVVADIKDKLWCGSGSQIYVVSKKGDRIQRIIAVDSNMKNLVKHVVGYGVGVWVSVWRKSTIKLYHAETCEMMQEVNVVSPVTKMKNDVDSQVQYLAVEKTTVTALVVIPGFLWVGTSLGLILLYPIPKLQGIPRVIGRACVAFHGHCGPVRSLFAIHDGPLPSDSDNDDDDISLATDENQKEIDRELSLLADSEDSVESDEEFYFVDDAKEPQAKKATSKLRKFKVSLHKDKNAGKETGYQSAPDTLDMKKLKRNDFARMVGNFSGFQNDGNISTDSDKIVDDETKIKSFKNRLYGLTQSQEDLINMPALNAVQGPVTGAETVEGSLPDSGDTVGGSLPSAEVNKADKSLSETGRNTVEESILGNEVPGKALPDERSPADQAGGKETNTVDVTAHAKEGEERIPVTETVEEAQNGTKTAPEEHTAPKASKPAVKEKPPRTHGVNRGNPTPGANNPPENDTTAKLEPIYVNLPPLANMDDKDPEDVTRANDNPANVSTRKIPRDDIDSSQATVAASEFDVESDSNTSQGLYTVVLPDPDENVDQTEPETVTEIMGSQSTKRSVHAMSYVVFSAGEGHVDLRMKLKSKSEIRKDNQTKLLIWRVNNKV